MSDDPTPENPYGDQPNDPNNPYGQNPYGQNPQNPYGQQNPGGDPYGQNPYGQPNPAQPQFEQGAYSATQSAAWAWKAFTQNIGVFLGLGLLTLLVPALVTVPSISTGTPEGASLVAISFSPFALVGGVIASAASFIFLLGISKAGLQVARTGQKAAFNDAFATINWGGTLLIALVYGAIIEVTSTLFFLPGLIATFLLIFLPVVVAISSEIDLGSAFKSAVNTVTSNFASTALLAIFCVLFIIAGVALCCVGLFAAVPMVQLAVTHGYLRITNQPVVS